MGKKRISPSLSPVEDDKSGRNGNYLGEAALQPVVCKGMNMEQIVRAANREPPQHYPHNLTLKHGVLFNFSLSIIRI